MTRTARCAGAAAVIGALWAIAGIGAAVAQGDGRPTAGIGDILSQRLSGFLAATAGHDISGHQVADGPQLIASHATEHRDIVFSPERCPPAAEVKFYEIAAVATRINLNRFGDHDPFGQLYTLARNVDAVRAMGEAGAGRNFGLSLGVADDVIQPMTMRANVGDCLRVTLTNLLEEATSFHVHGADLIVAATGAPALSTNPDAMALPGETVTYEWYIDPDYYAENTHYAHPHGPTARFQVTHGLFAAVIVEPAGADYLNPRSGEHLCGPPSSVGVRDCVNSWDAVISPGDGHDFREFAIFYHEVGNENFNVRARNGLELDAIEPVTVTYKPSGRAINYRSESFHNRMIQMDAAHPDFYARWNPDVALGYSSYSFGDPVTPIPQSYLGDPVKFRLIHGGSETFHVPHLHGGGIQWQRQPAMDRGARDYVPLNGGLQKQFAASMPSAGTDSQTIGPSETFDLEISCGAGGCQQSVGDYLFHCHIASHYVAGMWHFWRVYNTLQDAAHKTDQLAVVRELPDRRGTTPAAVTSEDLVGRKVAFAGRTVSVDEATLPSLVEAQLPPPGRRRDVQDAQVFDWARNGNLYLNEPEAAFSWTNYEPSDPGARPPLLFDPGTGKLAWPFLRPHLGVRPPFAPRHNPAPFLEPLGDANDEPAPPGTNGPASLCPSGTPRREFKIHAIQLPIRIAANRTLRDGMLYVLKDQEDEVRDTQAMKVPLAIRANHGDCIDVVLINELDGLRSRQRPLPFIDKTNIHMHFLQFDVQGSDGVPTGAAFEQAIRPLGRDGQAQSITSGVAAGSRRLSVDDADAFHPGATIAVGADQPLELFETATVAAVDGDDLVLAEPLKNDHRAGELVTVEFVRYRWYVARQNGAVYFHDHVDALSRWERGLFGALIAEPRDATFHDPQTGEDLRSGLVADIHSNGEAVPGLRGSFREYVLFLGDRTPDVQSSVNMRVEPVGLQSRRGGSGTDVLSSERHGDPFTPIFHAYAGDPIMMRILTGATEEIHPFILTGHQFRLERFQKKSPWRSSINIGISERFNAYIESAGGPMKRPGDYIFFNGIERHFAEGSWGLLRVHGEPTEALRPLPGRETLDIPTADASGIGDPCPADAPRRSYALKAVSVPITINTGGRFTDSRDRREGPQFISGLRYILDDGTDRGVDDPEAGEPLVIRANAGDCLELRLKNTTLNAIGLHIEGAHFDPQGLSGGGFGRNPDSVTEAGAVGTYRYYLPYETGALRIRDFGRPFVNTERQLYGALIVQPRGATYHDPRTDAEVEGGVAAVIRLPDGSFFREFVAMLVDHDMRIGRFVMPYEEVVRGDATINYRSEPLTPRLSRLGRSDDPKQALLFDDTFHGPPATEVFLAEAGDRVRFRVIAAFSEQQPVFSVEGHEWQLTPELNGSDVVSSRLVPSSGAVNAELPRAGGPAGRPGDYLWGNHRLPYMEAGQWGILRVLPRQAEEALGPRRGALLYTQLRL